MSIITVEESRRIFNLAQANKQKVKDLIEYSKQYRVEILKHVPLEGYERYLVNTKGDMYRETSTGLHLCNPVLTTKGYHQASLYSLESHRLKVTSQHRIVAAAFYGVWTNKMVVVNHINHIKTDNRIENLEIVYQRDNSGNRMSTTRRNNKQSRFIGVSRTTNSNRWRAFACIGGRDKHIGVFDSQEAASNARSIFLANLVENDRIAYTKTIIGD